MELGSLSETQRRNLEDVCEKYKLTPELLAQIMYHKIKGMNNTAIAEKLTVHRITVQRYLEAVRKMIPEEIVTIVSTAIKFIKQEVPK